MDDGDRNIHVFVQSLRCADSGQRREETVQWSVMGEKHITIIHTRSITEIESTYRIVAVDMWIWIETYSSCNC